MLTLERRGFLYPRKADWIILIQQFSHAFYDAFSLRKKYWNTFFIRCLCEKIIESVKQIKRFNVYEK
jgi:hypothetical protein